MLFALLYLVLRRLIGFAEGSKEDQSKDIEILVLRHQLKVLRRQAGRPRLRRFDRAFLAAASRALPRPAWASFVVSPQTLLRWHREMLRRKWTYRRKGMEEDRHLIRTPETSSSGSPGRTPGGAACGSTGSWASSGFGFQPRPSERFFVAVASILRRAAQARRGRCPSPCARPGSAR